MFCRSYSTRYVVTGKIKGPVLANKNPPPKGIFCIMRKKVIQERQKEMVREKMYKEVQSYKQIGYTIRGCARELKIDRKTVKKYWNMREDEYIILI